MDDPDIAAVNVLTGKVKEQQDQVLAQEHSDRLIDDPAVLQEAAEELKARAEREAALLAGMEARELREQTNSMQLKLQRRKLARI